METYFLSALAISNKGIQFLKKINIDAESSVCYQLFFPILHFGDNLRNSKNSLRQKICFKYLAIYCFIVLLSRVELADVKPYFYN